MAAVWSWHTLQGNLATITPTHWGVTVGYTPGIGESVQRLITFSRIDVISTQSGTLSGNPIASGLKCMLTITQTGHTGVVTTLYQRTTTVSPNTQSTISGTTVDRLTTWQIPLGMWDFDAQTRFKSTAGVEAITAVCDILTWDGTANPIKPSFVSGFLVARVLSSHA